MSGTLRLSAALVIAALAFAACDQASDGSATDSSPGGSSASPNASTGDCPEPARPAARGDEGRPSVSTISNRDAVGGSIAISNGAFQCAESVVVTLADDIDVAALSARLAAGVGGPLLYAGGTPSAELDAEIARLSPNRVIVVGEGPQITVPDDTELVVFTGDTAHIAELITNLVPATTITPLPPTRGIETVVATLRAIDGRLGLGPPDPAVTRPAAAVAFDDRDPDLPIMVGGPGTSGRVWLIDAASVDLALPSIVAATATEGLAAYVNGDDLRSAYDAAQAIRSSSGGAAAVHLVGDITSDAGWQIDVLTGAEEIPGGGYLMFPGRRLVALYGNPLTTDLGVLGEQGAEAGLERLLPIASQYVGDGLTIVPAFEIIVTVASGWIGEDGDYSSETAKDEIRPFIELAAERGAYVLLDLQSGRADSLSQARIYEEFLRLPHVGLALDPEWRLGPDQVHLEQIGHIDASEINEVSEWLAGIVREENLPQKMLLLHQFRPQMLPDREDIVARPELALVVQMDGQGEISTKFVTWDQVTAGWESHQWTWGWKNFYDEDFPTPTPAQVLQLSPTAVYVSYQ